MLLHVFETGGFGFVLGGWLSVCGGTPAVAELV
jgi:hypothetical protein